MYSSKRNKDFILFLLCIFSGCSSLFSQDYSYIRYDTKDGLAGSTVYDAIQDNEGFMWFATDNGLSRFDGKNFKTFTTKDGLPDNEILKLYRDSRGRLWIMPFKPSLCYYYKGHFYNSRNDSLLSKIKLHSYPFDMTEDGKGNLFIAEMTAWHTVFTNGVIHTVSQIDNSPVSVNAVGTGSNGDAELLISFHAKSKDENVHYLVSEQEENRELINYRPDWSDISTALISPDFVVIPAKQGSFEFSGEKKYKIISPKIPSNTVSINYIDKRKIVINTRSGIRLYDPETKTLSNSIFKNFFFTSAFEDKENNLWLTTQGDGVLMAPSFQFRNYSSWANKENPEITALSIASNTLYAGGWGGKIGRLNLNNFALSVQSSPATNGKMVSILRIKGKLFFFNSAYYQNPFAAVKDPSLAIKSATMGSSGLLFASHKRVLLCHWSGREEPIWNDRSTNALEKDSGFYIGTLNGLFYKSYSGEITNLGNAFPVFASRIISMASSDNGELWVATKGSGIAAYFNNKILYHLTEADGLTSDNCTSLYIDSNAVWLGTDKGVNRIEISAAGEKITRFSTSDGLPSNIINAIATSGKKVFIGTPKGLTYFEVDSISQKSECDLQLTGIYVANKYWAYDSTDFSLPHKDNDVRFEFSGISFKSAGEIKYQYRLLGLQPEWRTTSEKQLNFPSLSSGKYIFQLKALNKYGVESTTREVSFVVQKLLWEETWLRIVMIALFMSAIWAFFRYRIRSVRSKEKEQSKLNQHIAELEQKTLRSQMNPHFIFNSLNSIQQYVVERDITGANNFITDFSRLIRMTLDLSANSAITVSDEIDYIDTYLRVEKTRLENQFDYRISIDDQLDLTKIYLPPLLLQPYVENSIRHGIKYKKEENGLIKISLEKQEAGMLISIEDNGIGREAAQKYKSQFHIQYQSKGMNISKDRIDILNNYNDKKIKIQIVDLFNDNKASGTRVDIYLPT